MPSMAALEYGPIIRTLSPGEAFGELALLQPHCLRTATVIATPSTKQDESTSGSQDGISLLNTAILSAEEQSPHAAGVPDAAGERVSLIKLTRQLFDESVTSMQVTQLESRLSFLMKFNVRFNDLILCPSLLSCHSLIALCKSFGCSCLLHLAAASFGCIAGIPVSPA